MLTGGFEAAVTPIGVAAFDRMRALSHRNDDPGGASRPFDADRDGFVIAEGGALLVLEDLQVASLQGVCPLVELIAYAAHVRCRPPHRPGYPGPGCSRRSACFAAFLLAPNRLSYINAHGTATPGGDPAETRAIHAVLGEAAQMIPVSSTKSCTGHMLAGAGAFEAVVCTQAILNGRVSPTINLTSPDPQRDLDYVPLQGVFCCSGNSHVAFPRLWWAQFSLES